MSASIDMTIDGARAAVLRSFGLKSSNPSVCAIRAEAIRAALWSLSGEGERPVYVTRLLNAVSRTLLPWTETAFTSEGEPGSIDLLARAALDELELIGEATALSGGWWLPAPLRFVHLPVLRRWLVLGAVPIVALPPQAQAQVEVTAIARLLCTRPEALGLPPRIMELAVWQQAPSEPIEPWAQGIVQRTQLQDYPGQGDSLEVYAPALRKVPSQYDRWHRLSGRLATGRYLARMTSRYGPTTYFIAEVRAGKIIAAGQPVLAQGDIRRLMYGIDAISGYPVSIYVTKEELHYHFKLKSEVPTSEHRLLLALGRLQLDPSGAYYPRIWEVAVEHAEQVSSALRQLQVQIVDKGAARHDLTARSARL